MAGLEPKSTVEEAAALPSEPSHHSLKLGESQPSCYFVRCFSYEQILRTLKLI